MTRRKRLTATFQGQAVDRPAVSFYEIGGWKMEPDNDEFTVWNAPSWRPLVRLAHQETDIIRLVAPAWKGMADRFLAGVGVLDALADLATNKVWREGDSIFTRTDIRAPGRTLTTVTRRDKDVQTVWVIEHLLKSIEDLEAFLQLRHRGTP